MKEIRVKTIHNICAPHCKVTFEIVDASLQLHYVFKAQWYYVKKQEFVPTNAIQIYRASGVIAPFILNLGTRRS